MALSKHLELKLRKRYTPSSTVDLQYKGNLITIKTDRDGNAVMLFIGKKRDENGNIQGERYARTLKTNHEGAVIKDHWELKGKAS